MPTREKQERIIEAVRRGLEGDAAVEFIHQSGYAITSAGIARHLRTMDGRGRIQELVDQGLSNIEILQKCFPDDDLSDFRPPPPSQGELFGAEAGPRTPAASVLQDIPLYDTTKLTIRVPTELYASIRLAAKAEKKSQNQLIVEILTAALSRMPEQLPGEDTA